MWAGKHGEAGSVGYYHSPLMGSDVCDHSGDPQKWLLFKEEISYAYAFIKAHHIVVIYNVSVSFTHCSQPILQGLWIRDPYS